MMLAKGTVVLLLLVLVVDPVVGGCVPSKMRICTQKHKEHFVRECRTCLYKTSPIMLPVKTSPCCQEVRTLLAINSKMLECVKERIICDEHKDDNVFDTSKIQLFPAYCAQASSPPPPHHRHPDEVKKS
ncbi:hypothetical protein BS78_05G112600 [Paspalum vaginatum]|nr:hypothetical protein BS78_05G112600 [Paspalum vaginatum]